MTNNMSKIKFSVFQYRALIEQKLKVLTEIDELYNEQNKELFQKLVDEGFLEPDLSKPVGIILKDDNTAEENKHNESILQKLALAFQKHNLQNTTLIELNDFESKLLITSLDIAKCIEP